MMKCANCKWFYSGDPDSAGSTGECRRNAPRAHTDANATMFAIWPVVRASSFCGEFRGKDA